MYGCFRFYVNHIEGEEINSSVLKAFELFRSLFTVDYDYIYYLQFDLESDRLIRNKEFPYNEEGKVRFLSEEILPPMTGPDGDLSEPVIGATCRARRDKLYEKIRCEITVGKPPFPTVLRVDFCDRWLKHSVSLPDYRKMLAGLTDLGFSVGTAFYHMCCSKKEAGVLDREHIGSLLHPEARRILDSFLWHDPAFFSSHLADVFCANTLPLETLENGLRQRIEDIAGEENTFVLDDRLFCFSLPRLESLNGMYRIRNRGLINRLRECIRDR